MFEKIKNTDFRLIAFIIGIIGFLLIFASAGISDAGAEVVEFAPYGLAGLVMMLSSFAYIFWFEY